MDNFTNTVGGYKKEEVNEFVDYVIKKTEENILTIVVESKSQQESIVCRLQAFLIFYLKNVITASLHFFFLHRGTLHPILFRNSLFYERYESYEGLSEHCYKLSADIPYSCKHSL